ncbi:unnamed protein product [Clavelina lepadiformis]|uniref:Kaptin n=1 Tax=Clavelina lepadiformis TaxID=159417 RepID=A0ABP0EYB5_CLALP
MSVRPLSDELFHEANFDALPSQSSIYGVTSLCNIPHLSNKILVALAKGRIFACEYHKPANPNYDVLGVNREVTFTYIPADCHIISIDNFSCAARGLIVGVTFCKELNENFFNVYCNYGDDVPSGQEWNLDNVAQNCRSFNLTFTPYQLTHCKVLCPQGEEQTGGDTAQVREQRTVFILLGSDRSFHVYAQNEVEFVEEPTKKYFCELDSITKQPIFLEMKNISDMRRLSIAGYECGSLSMFLVDSFNNSITASWTIEHDSPIVQCQLFANNRESSEGVEHNVVVVSAREEAMIYRNLLASGFSNPLVLSGSSKYDCVTCCAVADVNYDGIKEVLIGTFGQRLLAYSSQADRQPYTQQQPMWTRNMAHPVLSIKFMDMTGDSIEDMAVISSKGVHIFQSDLVMLLKMCKSKIFHKNVDDRFDKSE